jgi:isopentenyldiphosphate isomerase
VTSQPDFAQDPDELFDVVTADGRRTGRIKTRAAIHRDGDWHRALHVWVIGLDEQGTSFLTFQRRSPLKDTWPDHYDVTVGGHYRAGETFVETLREIEEEIGISANGLELIPLGIHICANEAVPGTIDRELQDVYFLQDDRPLTAFYPNPAELAALARFPLEALLPFLAGETTEVHGASIAPGDTHARQIVAYANEFIPNVDRYNLRVAIAAKNVLRGDRYVAI